MTINDMLRRESRRRIKRLLKNLLSVWRFFGHLALRLDLIEDAKRKTIAADGRAIRYSPEWIAQTDDATIRAAIAGIVLACALKHHTRRGDRDYGKWQWASSSSAAPVPA